MARASTATPAALLAQAGELLSWLDHLEPTDLDRPSALPGWEIRTLVGHLVLVLTEGAETLARTSGGPALALHEIVRRSAPAEIDARARASAAEPAVGEQLHAAVERLTGVLAGPLPRVVSSARGPVLAADFLATTVIELVVHSDDLARTAPGAAPDQARATVRPPSLHRSALAVATRTLAELLAGQRPGRSIEVRVPPFAAVQCGLPGDPGPRHTRGTPPNVVETDPVTFLRLATGRVSWSAARADGRVVASGVRADLEPVLPVLC